jgi:hypothetical protein
MDNVTGSQLNHTSFSTLSDRLPLSVSLDGEKVAVILRLKDYNQLVGQARQTKPQEEKPMEHYIIKRVKGELVKQETDLDGYPIYE